MDTALEARLNALLQADEREAIGALIAGRDRETQVAMNRLACGYFLEQGQYVDAVFCASHAGDGDRVFEILDIPDARQQAQEFIPSNVYIQCSHGTPLGLLNTPYHDLYWMLHFHAGARKPTT